jgi:hypothetical protein
MYHLLADLVFVLHLCFICFVICGGILVWQWRRMAFLHIPAVAWGLAIEFLDAPCPLTPLEQTLLHKAGAQAYQGGFIDHYIVPLIYPEANSRFFLEAGIFLLLINCAAYAVLIIRLMAKKSPQ